MPSFTRTAIKNSFWKLLNERPLNKITVKDIVEDCGINRNSFYYYFDDLPSLIEESIRELIDTAMQEHVILESLEQCFSVIIDVILQNKRAVYHIYNSLNPTILERYLLKICQHAMTIYINTIFHDAALNDSDKQSMIYYYQCACFGQIIEWLNNGIKDDEIWKQIHQFCSFSEKITKRLLENNSDN